MHAELFAGAVGEKRALIIPEGRISDRRLDADAGRAAGHNQMPDPAPSQQLVKFGPVEAAEAGLVEDRVGNLRCQPVDDGRPPGIANESTALTAVGRSDNISDLEPIDMEGVVRSARQSEVGQIGQIAHLEIDDLEVTATGRGQDGSGRSNRLSDTGDVDTGAIEHAACRAEIVLHVDDQDGGPREIEFERLGPASTRVRVTGSGETPGQVMRETEKRLAAG